MIVALMVLSVQLTAMADGARWWQFYRYSHFSGNDGIYFVDEASISLTPRGFVFRTLAVSERELLIDGARARIVVLRTEIDCVRNEIRNVEGAIVRPDGQSITVPPPSENPWKAISTNVAQALRRFVCASERRSFQELPRGVAPIDYADAAFRSTE